MYLNLINCIFVKLYSIQNRFFYLFQFTFSKNHHHIVIKTVYRIKLILKRLRIVYSKTNLCKTFRENKNCLQRKIQNKNVKQEDFE